MIWLIGSLATDGLFGRTEHRGAHRRFHRRVIVGLTVDHSRNGVLALRDAQVDFNLTLLAEPPEPAHGLIPSLI